MCEFKIKLSTPILYNAHDAYDAYNTYECNASTRVPINRFLWRLQSDINVFRLACERRFSRAYRAAIFRTFVD